MGTLLLGAALFFWLLCSGCFKNLSQLLISPWIDFVILIAMMIMCVHYNFCQNELKKINLTFQFGNPELFC